MAFRRPLKIENDNLKEMSDDDIHKLRLRAIVNHGRQSSVQVGYVSNGGNLGTLRDTRRVSTNFIDLEAGDSADATSTTLIETNFRHMDLQYDSHFMMRMADSNLMKYPVFFDSALDGQPEGIRAMTETDFYDTIIKPAIDIITTGNIGDSTQGIYYLKTTNTPTSTLINSSPVFTDTTADVTKFNTKDSAGEFIEPLDQPRIEQNYYLHKIQSDSSISPGDRLVRPLLIGDISNHGTIQEMDSNSIDDMLWRGIRYVSRDVNGYKIRYHIDSSYSPAPSGSRVGTLAVDKFYDAEKFIQRHGDSGAGGSYGYGYVGYVPFSDPSDSTNSLRIKRDYALKITKE